MTFVKMDSLKLLEASDDAILIIVQLLMVYI